jgi:hypothetical protein
MAERQLEKYFDMSAGSYCGVLIKEKLAKKLQKLLYKQSLEIQKLLGENIDELQLSNWTLVYPDNKQTSINYFENNTNEEKMERIKLFNKADRIKYIPDVFYTDKKYTEASEDVQNTYMKEFEGIL